MTPVKNILHTKQTLSNYIISGIVLLLFTFICLPVQSQEIGIENLKETGHAFASVAKKVSPAVVYIEVETTVANQSIQNQSPFGGVTPDDFFRHFFGPNFPGQQPGQSPQFKQVPQPQQRMMGQGSGFIISKDGYILTNNHVVGDADKVTVKLEDGREFIAETIGTDPHSDVAVIKIDAQGLPVISLGDSDALNVGEWVVAIGNPFGLSHTLTVGVVSAKGRSNVGLADYENFIQTDAAINPGNSGGPLVDLDGKVIGMNTAIFSRSGGYMGIGFAIPVNMLERIKDQLIDTGEVNRGYLGIVIQDLTSDLAESFGLNKQNGIVVSQVSEDSPAEKSGLKQGDVIIEFDGKTVTEVGSFRNRVAMKEPGSNHNIKILRKGKQKTLSVTIGKLPAGESIASSGSIQYLDKLGLTLQNLTPSIAQQLNLEESDAGVVVTQVTPGSVADMASIEAGFLIQQVNHQAVSNIDEFRKAIAETSKNGSVLLLVKNGQYSSFVVLKVK
jgi:serine protease Do